LKANSKHLIDLLRQLESDWGTARMMSADGKLTSKGLKVVRALETATNCNLTDGWSRSLPYGS